MKFSNKIGVGFTDFLFNFIYGLLVFWGLTQTLEVAKLGEIYFLVALSSILSPLIVMSLPNFVLLSNEYDYRDKLGVASLYTIITTLLLGVIFTLCLFIASYEIIIILFIFQSLLSLSEALPRTLWKNREAGGYVFKNLLFVVGKSLIISSIFVLAPSLFIVGVILTNFVTTIFFWQYVKPARLRSKFALEILKAAYKFAKPLLISGFFVLLYTRVDQVMIGSIMGSESVAKYSVAVKLNDGIVGVWTSIQAFFLHTLLGGKNSYRPLMGLAWLFGMASFLSLLLISDFLVPFIFGAQYQESSFVLLILSSGTSFIALNSLGAIWLQSRNLGSLTPTRSFCGLAVNVVANMLLIPPYGLVGAAIATVLAQFSVCFVAPLFSIKSRELINIQLLVREK